MVSLAFFNRSYGFLVLPFPSIASPQSHEVSESSAITVCIYRRRSQDPGLECMCVCVFVCMQVDGGFQLTLPKTRAQSMMTHLSYWTLPPGDLTSPVLTPRVTAPGDLTLIQVREEKYTRRIVCHFLMFWSQVKVNMWHYTVEMIQGISVCASTFTPAREVYCVLERQELVVRGHMHMHTRTNTYAVHIHKHWDWGLHDVDVRAFQLRSLWDLQLHVSTGWIGLFFFFFKGAKARRWWMPSRWEMRHIENYIKLPWLTI